MNGKRDETGPKPVGHWLHIAAMNLIADHEAGVKVDPEQLETARKLVASLADPARARFEEGGA